MKKSPDISDEEFEALLNWLSTDSNDAGQEYEKIREGLIRFFRFRGCSDAESLTDETINRVAKKVKSLDFSQNKSKLSIFQGFALNVYREYVRVVTKEVQLIPEYPLKANPVEDIEKNSNSIELCLNKCLAKLSSTDKKLILQYYCEETNNNILFRKKIAEDNQITSNALTVRVFRIKNLLKECINDCNKKKNL